MYFLVTLAAALITGRLPLLANVASVIPWYMSDLALPAVLAAVLTMIRVEGRPFHVAAYVLGRYRTGHRWLAGMRPCPAVGMRWYPAEVVFLPDGSDSRMRRLRYSGPGAVLVAVEHERVVRARLRWLPSVSALHRPALTVREPSCGSAHPSGQVIALGAGARLLVRSSVRPEG